MKDNTVIGFAMCGSFCTLSSAIDAMEKMAGEYSVIPIMSEMTYSTDTRFGTASEFIDRVRGICKREVIHTVAQAEPIGPRALTDVMVIAPCTGNTLAKLANGITDTSVTMAAKAHLRNGRPLVIALATNDALAGSAKNIGMLLNFKNVYFVPFSQDDCKTKERSCIADFSRISEAVKSALSSKQLPDIINAK